MMSGPENLPAHVTSAKTTATYGPPRGAQSYWYCCECGFGPMTLDITPSCVYCENHHRCYQCRIDN
ncbi:hypothetical protein F5B19DRAFT_458656 [Rostrohypoxylon terebratum]|nr:hypothetical protein F5B19DRAFT_458656 [Rostrohypoxylon terebratum]